MLFRSIRGMDSVASIRLAVIADRFLMAHRAQIIDFAAGSGLPAMYPYREYVDSGGLMSYAPSVVRVKL